MFILVIYFILYLFSDFLFLKLYVIYFILSSLFSFFHTERRILYIFLNDHSWRFIFLLLEMTDDTLQFYIWLMPILSWWGSRTWLRNVEYNSIFIIVWRSRFSTLHTFTQYGFSDVFNIIFMIYTYFLISLSMPSQISIIFPFF